MTRDELYAFSNTVGRALDVTDGEHHPGAPRLHQLREILDRAEG